MTQEAVLYIRQSWVQIVSVYAEKGPLFQLPSLCKTLGSQPGLVTYGRGDTVPCCPLLSQLHDLAKSTGPFPAKTCLFLPCNVNQMWRGPLSAGGPLPNSLRWPQVHGRQQWPASLSWPSACLALTAGSLWHPCISPSHNVTGSWKGHWTNVQSPYVLDGLSRNFGDATLLHASCPFHS